jgi:DNA-binding NtrC family response regulator
MSKLDGQHILVIEDDFLISVSIVDELIEAGATAAGVNSQPDALDHLTSCHFTAAVVDINLGRGPDYASATNLQKAGIPFIFVTGYDSDKLPHEFKTVPLVTKPHSADALVDALLRAIDLATAQ